MAQTQIQTLANGLTVIMEANPHAKSAAMGYFVRTGSRDELQPSGVSHFLEHMLFKGTDSLRAADINREFDEIGARYNAFTSEDVTVYYGAVLPDFRSRLLTLLSKMMRPALRNEDFDLEKKVILEEIKMYDDRPQFRVFDILRPRYFRHHPLGNSILGTHETISSLSRDEMAIYHSSRYVPNNMVFAATGQFDPDQLIDEVTKATRDWQPQDAPRAQPNLNAQAFVQTVEQPDLAQVHIALLCPAVGAHDPLYFAAEVLSTALGDGEGSRFHWALVDPGLADEASFSLETTDVGAFVGYFATEPKNAQKVLDIVRDVLQSVQRKGLEPAEFERAKRKFAVSLALQAETPMGRLFPLALEYLETAALLSLNELTDRVRAVHMEDINAVLEKRPFDALGVVALGPVSGLQ